MNFSELNLEVTYLRGALRNFVGDEALSEISVTPPVGDDEASFFRLVAWGYALLYETGRVTIPYLMKLPCHSACTKQNHAESRSLVHDIRTWSFHNLGFSDERHVKISNRVHRWFISNGGADPPINREGWQQCFGKLCTEVNTIILHCRNSISTLANPDDGDRVVADLKRRLDLDWPAYKFDSLVEDAATKFGRTVNSVEFRKPRLETWREFLRTVPAGDDPEELLIRLIERDVLDHFGSLLPISASDVINALGLNPGLEVDYALIYARILFGTGTTDPEELLESVRSLYESDSWIPSIAIQRQI